jgi:hypothetical protein
MSMVEDTRRFARHSVGFLRELLGDRLLGQVRRDEAVIEAGAMLQPLGRYAPHSAALADTIGLGETVAALLATCWTKTRATGWMSIRPARPERTAPHDRPASQSRQSLAPGHVRAAGADRAGGDRRAARSQAAVALAGGTIVGMMVLSRWKSRKGSLAIGILAIITSTRYIFWRTTQTLSFGTPFEALFGTGLYLAELYAWVLLILGFLQTTWPLERPVAEIEGDPETWPTVDVYIPTYNESLDIVRNTVFAAMDMDYPHDRFKVFILDDGRRPEFRAFAREAGCGYITRDNNLHAKAGNLNAAMKKTEGELIAIFDCDHVPTRAFLQLTVAYFQKERKLALMQTPHFFYSPDPVQRNLATAKHMPGEGDLFYGPVQGGNDLWNATFFCGSCAVIRREALMETNGFAGETVTEDAHTALKLQRTGWSTAYISARLSAGLATERLVLHIGQRIRWARDDADPAHRESAARPRPEVAAAAVLPQCHAALPVSAAAHLLPDQPAGLPDLRPEHHRGLGLADLCLCRAAPVLLAGHCRAFAGR